MPLWTHLGRLIIANGTGVCKVYLRIKIKNMKTETLKAIEEAYRKGLRDAKGVNDITPYLLTSQVVAHEVANKFCKPHVIKSVCVCSTPKYNYPEMIWCDNCGKEIPRKQTVL